MTCPWRRLEADGTVLRCADDDCDREGFVCETDWRNGERWVGWEQDDPAAWDASCSDCDGDGGNDRVPEWGYCDTCDGDVCGGVDPNLTVRRRLTRGRRCRTVIPDGNDTEHHMTTPTDTASLTAVSGYASPDGWAYNVACPTCDEHIATGLTLKGAKKVRDGHNTEHHQAADRYCTCCKTMVPTVDPTYDRCPECYSTCPARGSCKR